MNLIRSRPGEQYLFLNRRYIKDRLINQAIYKAYDSLIKRGEFPFFVLNLMLPLDQADVNVHPMKTEVRFKDEWRVFNVLKSCVNESISSILDTIPDFDKSFQQSNIFQNNNKETLNSSFKTNFTKIDIHHPTLVLKNSMSNQFSQTPGLNQNLPCIPKLKLTGGYRKRLSGSRAINQNRNKSIFKL